MQSLLLYGRVAEDDPPRFIRNIDYIVQNWKRTIRAWGGYWLGSFRLGEEASREEMLWWFNEYLGCHVVEETAGMTSWEGLVYEMLLTLDGVQYRRTLDKEWFQNKVKVVYRDAGAQAETAYSEDTDSSDVYGEMNYIDSLSEATSSEATALRDTRLADFADPKSRIVGGLQFMGDPRPRAADNLQVTVAGYVFTLNWRYRETDIAATAASTAIEDLVDDSEFVSAGTIDTNLLSVDVDCSTPQRLWDAAEDIIRQGDTAGNRWVGGVYAGRVFNYGQAQVNEVDYYVRGGMLLDKDGAPVIKSLVTPDAVVQNANAPSG